MEDILSTILKDTYSLTQLKHRLRVLKANLLQAFFGNDHTLPLPPEDVNWLKSLPAGFYRQFNKDNVYQIFSQLEEELARLNILTVYLTFEPDNLALSKIGSFARNTFQIPLLVLDIKLDPKLISGAALSWKGVFKDYSLKTKIENQKTEIREGFKRFLR